MAYEASRGGHAPRYLREDFLSALAEYVDLSDEDADAPFVKDRLRRLCGLLWNCTDRLPSSAYWDVEIFVPLGDEQPVKYNEAARVIRWRLDLEAEMRYRAKPPADPMSVIKHAIDGSPELYEALFDFYPDFLQSVDRARPTKSE